MPRIPEETEGWISYTAMQAKYQGNAEGLQEKYEANYKANTTGFEQITKQNIRGILLLLQ